MCLPVVLMFHDPVRSVSSFHVHANEGNIAVTDDASRTNRQIRTTFRRDSCLPVVPMFHVNAWGIPYGACMAGCKIVLPGANLDGKVAPKPETRNPRPEP